MRLFTPILVRIFGRTLHQCSLLGPKSETVSYYFNVFMLRRRAAQNRSKVLNIDSDDDEWHDNNGGSFVVQVNEDRDLRIETPVCDYHAKYAVGSPEEDDDGMADYRSKPIGGGRFDSVIQPLNRNQRSYRESFDVQDNSCISFERQGCTAKSCDGGGGYSAGEAGLKNNHYKSLFSKVDGSSDGLGLIYLLEPCDAKGWDPQYPTDPVKSVDLLPTCNMIDEIFGQGTWNSKEIND